MNLRDLATLDKDDLLDKLGLPTKSSGGAAVAAALGTFGVGLLVGVGIGFMLAPKSGRGLREDIRDRLRGATEALDGADASPGRAPEASPTSAGG